jgi:mannan endo-1,6-alpha-mannosidase
MLHQVGPKWNHMPPNQSHALGNDDQTFWGLAALPAAEFLNPDPPQDRPQWLALAEAIFDAIVSQWDYVTCGGEFRWQVYAYFKLRF